MMMYFRHFTIFYHKIVVSRCFQDGLRRRMDKLKSSIEEANLAVDKEREKNVSLLHMIFPPNIAKRLWLGKYIVFHFAFIPIAVHHCFLIFLHPIKIASHLHTAECI